MGSEGPGIAALGDAIGVRLWVIFGGCRARAVGIDESARVHRTARLGWGSSSGRRSGGATGGSGPASGAVVGADSVTAGPLSVGPIILLCPQESLQRAAAPGVRRTHA